jgi:D-serine deaminase-like pyridoxal phosphate-dependent protein
MKRRYFLVGAVLFAGAFAWWKKPRDAGAPYDGYFSLLNQELKKNGPMRPCMVIDLDRMDQNIDRVTQTLKLAGKNYRIVEKSLPSQRLIEYIAQRAQTQRLMSFHQPFLNLDAEIFQASTF